MRAVEASIHLHGDSFATSDLNAAIAARTTDKQRAYTIYSVPGGTLADQATNFAGTPLFYDRILVIMDGGLTDSYATAIASIEDMVSRLTPYHKWLYVQSGLDSTRSTGQALRTTIDQVNAYMVTNYPDNYVETKTTAQSFAISDTGATGYANDQTDLGNDIWPRSLTSDGLHPTAIASPNTSIGQSVSGNAMLADLIANKIIAKGW